MAQQTRTFMDDARTLDPTFFLLVGAVANVPLKQQKSATSRPRCNRNVLRSSYH